MEPHGWAQVTPQDEITRHAAIMEGIFDCLPGRDLMSARLVTSSWGNFIADMIKKKERVRVSPLRPLDLTHFRNLHLFLDQFPDEFPPGRIINLFQFVNIKIRSGTPMSELIRLFTIHGPQIKFLTLLLPPDEVALDAFLPTIELIMEKCRGREGTCIQSDLRDENVDAGSLTGIHIQIQKLECTIRRKEDETSVILDSLGSPEHLHLDLTMVNFTLPVLNSVVKMIEDDDFHHEIISRVKKLHVMVSIHDDLSEEAKQSLADHLEKFGTIDDLKIWNRPTVDGDNFRLRLPPTLNIRKLNLNSLLDSPLLESQVPNLEHVEIPAWEVKNPRENPFETETVYPKMKYLKLAMDNQAVTWKFGFPNLEKLEMSLPEAAIGTLGTFLSQFPTLISLNLIYCSGSNKKYRQEAWWDLLTGGSRPVMTNFTSEDVILGKVQLVTQNSRPRLLEGLPNFRRLKLEKCPEVIAFGVVHLTATERIQRLEFLEMETTGPLQKCYREILASYHKWTKISVLAPLPAVGPEHLSI